MQTQFKQFRSKLQSAFGCNRSVRKVLSTQQGFKGFEGEDEGFEG